MKAINVVAVILVVTCFTSTVKSLEILTAEGQHPCGSILNETSGILQYKPFEQANKNERCVWIIRVPSASGYNFTLYNLGYEGSFDRNALHIAGLHRGEHTLRATIPGSRDTNYFINGSVAILTYYSSANFYEVGRGFSLYWTADYRGSTNIPVSQNSATEIVSTLSRNISHPQDTTGMIHYDDLELSIFLYTPEFTNNGTLHENEVRFVQLGLDGITCSDFIDVFVFNHDYPNPGWYTYGRFCGPDSDVSFSGKDMVLLAFHSDASQNNTGFELIYRRKDLL